MLPREATGPDQDRNVVVATFDARGLRHARRFLARHGQVGRTHFHNVLVLKVADVDRFLGAMAESLRGDVQILNDASRIAPAQATFDFRSVADFGEKARAIVLRWVDRLAGHSIHARLNQRRGDPPVKLSSLAVERVKLCSASWKSLDSLAASSSPILIYLSISRRSAAGAGCPSGRARTAESTLSCGPTSRAMDVVTRGGDSNGQLAFGA